MAHNDQASFVYLTFHHGPQCRSKPYGYSIKPYRLNECISESGVNYKLACYIGLNKATLVKKVFSDTLCTTQTSSVTYQHEDTCKAWNDASNLKDPVKINAPLAYALTHCDPLVPADLGTREQLLVESFALPALPPATPYAPTPAPSTVFSYGGLTGVADTLATFLNQCVEVTEFHYLAYHRRVTYVSGDGVNTDLVVREVRFTPKDRCKNTAPVISDRLVVYAKKTADKPCLPDPLYPGRCYKVAIRTSNVNLNSNANTNTQAAAAALDASVNQLPRLVYKPTSKPTTKPAPAR